jgi:hypothetical protein
MLNEPMTGMFIAIGVAHLISYAVLGIVSGWAAYQLVLFWHSKPR